MFHSLIDYKIRFRRLFSDGDSKTYFHLQEEQPYGKDHPIQKVDCIGQAQKLAYGDNLTQVERPVQGTEATCIYTMERRKGEQEGLLITS